MEQNGNDNRQAVIKTRFFGGFDKKEVLSYIDRLREENASAREELDKRLEEVSAARNELDEQVRGFESKLAEMNGELDERSGRIRELNDEITRLQLEIKAANKNADETGRELSLQREQNRLLTERGREREEKARRYDSVSAQVGDIILSARCSADELIDAASVEADRIKSDAEKASERARNELLSLRTELGRMREQMAEMAEGFSNRITVIEDIIDEIDPQKNEECEENAEPCAPQTCEKDAKAQKSFQEREIARVVEGIESRRQAAAQNLLGRIFKER